MPKQSWFLVVADYRLRKSTVSEFSGQSDATDAYALAEAEHRRERHIEVVLIAADDLETLQRTYPHLFGARKVAKKAALADLATPAFAS